MRIKKQKQGFLKIFFAFIMSNLFQGKIPSIRNCPELPFNARRHTALMCSDTLAFEMNYISSSHSENNHFAVTQRTRYWTLWQNRSWIIVTRTSEQERPKKAVGASYRVAKPQRPEQPDRAQEKCHPEGVETAVLGMNF